MAIDITKAPSFLLDTDFFADNIVYLKTGNFTATASSSQQVVTIPHGLSFKPLVGGNWSQTANFNIAYEYATGVYPTTVSGFIFSTMVNIASDATNIYLIYDNVQVTSQPIFYRIYGHEPTTDDVDIAPLTSGDSFFLSTDYNNPKLYSADTVILPATGGSPGSATLVHNLGYIPQLVTWVDNGSYISPTGSSAPLIYVSGVTVNTGINSFVFNIPAGSPQMLGHFRLFLDS